MGKYVDSLNLKEAFSKIWLWGGFKYGVEQNDVREILFENGKRDTIFIKLHIMNHAVPTGEVINLIVSDYDIIQFSNSDNKISKKDEKTILSGLFGDNQGYFRDWKQYHIKKTNSILRKMKETCSNEEEIESTHNALMRNVREGLPRFVESEIQL